MSTQNEHIHSTLLSAISCVEELIKQGLTVLEISIKETKPIIYIQEYSPLHNVNWVDIYAVKQDTHAEKKYGVLAGYMNCQVRWQTADLYQNNPTGCVK